MKKAKETTVQSYTPTYSSPVQFNVFNPDTDEEAADYSIISEIQISYKATANLARNAVINASKIAYSVLKDCWDLGKIEYQEQVNVLFLNRAKRVIGFLCASTGGMSGTVVDPRLIFGAALKANADTIILAHNHPSGTLTPSEADKIMTNEFKRAGEFLQIKLIDHLIITQNGYFSFADGDILY